MYVNPLPFSTASQSHFTSTSSLSVTRSPRTPTVLSSPKVQQVHTRLIAIIRRLVENYGTWQLGHEKGTRFCSQLEAIKLKLLDKASPSTGSNDNDNSTASVFGDDLTAWHQKLQVVMEVLVDVVKNASDSVHQLRALQKLQPIEDHDTIIGRTWPLRRFVAVTEILLGQYEKELLVKETVFREICHRTSAGQVVLTACAWSYPRWISKEAQFIVKCLAIECGLPGLVELAGNK